MKPATLPLLYLLALSGAASATVINFDFNLRLPDDDDSNVAMDTYVGLGAAPDSPGNTHWNSVRRTSSGNVSSASGLNDNAPGGGPIADSAGVVTTVDILLTSTTGVAGETSIGHQRSVGQQELGNSLGYEDLMADFLQLDAPGADSAGNLGTVNGTINGLTAGGLYEIFFYGQSTIYGTPGSSTSGANSFFAITDGLGGSIIGSGEQTGWDGTNGGNGTLTEGIEYVKLSATADSSGNIYFIWQNVIAGVNVGTDSATDGSGGSSDLASLNAIQVVSVPEPSAAFLGGLGLLGLVLRRRR
jgi:MYXO-CTERM domain-containing protein